MGVHSINLAQRPVVGIHQHGKPMRAKQSAPSPAMALRFGEDTTRFGLPSTEFKFPRAFGNPLELRFWHTDACKSVAKPAAVEAPTLADTVPTDKPIMLVVHGLSSQTSWLTPYVKELAARHPEMAYVGLDIPEVGTQLSSNLGFSDDAVNKVSDAIAALSRHTNRPILVTGVSLGGLLVTRAAAREKEQVRGLVLISPAFAPSRRKMAAGLEKLLGRPIIEAPPEFPNEPGLLKKLNPEQLAAYREKNIPGRLPDLDSKGNLQLLGMTLRSKYLDALRLSPPLPKAIRKLLGTDKIPVISFSTETDNMVSPKAVRHFMRRLRSQDNSHTYKQAQHNLCLDPRMPDMVAHISAWLETLPTDL